MDDLRVDGKWKLEEIIIKTATVFSFPSMFFEQMNDIESVVRGFFTKWGWYCSIFRSRRIISVSRAMEGINRFAFRSILI